MKLFNLEDVENFSINQVWDLYRKYVNNSQVDLISKFGFGKDLVIKSEGNIISLHKPSFDPEAKTLFANVFSTQSLGVDASGF